MQILSFTKIDSTNTYAKKHMDELEDRTVISADVQTNGRGRFTRSWVHVGADNIYITFVLKPKVGMPDSNEVSEVANEVIPEVYSNLTQYLAVLVCFQLEKLGLSPKIKWPNDVLVNGKKVSGILAEAVFKNGKLKGIALGIGINLNTSPEILNDIDRPATSLNIELGKSIDKKSFMHEFVNEFFKDYDEFIKNGFISIKQDYIKRSNFVNQRLKVAVFKTVKEGLVLGVDDKGALILQLDNNIVEHLNMGEIV